MDKHVWLAEQFEAERPQLQAVAYRMLGNLSEAEDAVQESWLRLSRSDTSSIENLGGWLTTVVARISLDMLRSRKSRREQSLEASVPESIKRRESGTDPEQEALLADSVGLALLVILDTLAPAERLAFVLHDIFAMPFEEIAPIVERTPAAARQLASRARRRVRVGARLEDAALNSSREVVEAFLAASRAGNFEALLAVLDPDVVYRDDRTISVAGASREVRGAASVARQFVGRAETARPVLVDGSVGIVVAPYGRLLLVANLTIAGGKITEINVTSDPAHLLLSGVAPEVEQRTRVNYAAVVCLLSVRIGYILFGVDALRYRLLPRWNLLPLLLGSTVVLSLPFDWFGVPAFLPSQLASPFLHFAITGACWVLLGIAIMNQRREPLPAAAI